MSRFPLLSFTLAVVLALSAHEVTAVQETPLPQIVKHDGGFEMQVDGRPFLMLGGQVHNSSGSEPVLSTAWEQLQQLHGNTLEVPVYWSELEPEEGTFDFTQVRRILQGARAHDLRVVLLWFATWKNGTMDYTPSWLKADPERFPRMLDEAGKPVRVLSPHSRANLDADRKAFEALMTFLRDEDPQHTAVMMQIQNEPGSLFVARDHSASATAAFEAAVPGELTGALGVPAGTWRDVFGHQAEEAFSGYAIAQYIEQLAQAGKAIKALPMSVNVWLRERKSWERAGEQYPSGGPTSNLLDLWKFAAPTVDVLAPDIYVRDYVGFRAVCDSYLRPDNPLLIPETFSGTEGARYVFYGVGDFDAIGYAPFGFNRRDGETELLEYQKPVAKSFRLLANAAPLLLELRRKSTPERRLVQAAVEEHLLTNHLLEFEGWDVLVQFGQIRRSYGGEFPTGTENRTGRALVLHAGPDEFFVLGVDASIKIRPADRSQTAQFLRVEEGHFEGGEWTASRPLNGDQTFFSLRLGSEGKILRAQLIAGAGGGEHP